MQQEQLYHTEKPTPTLVEEIGMIAKESLTKTIKQELVSDTAIFNMIIDAPICLRFLGGGSGR
jgi:hypothetical protein